MVDFHSHILPGIDDGATDVDMSIRMLKRAYEDGVDTVVSTSHAYIIDDESIEDFLERRKMAYNLLCKAMKADGGEFPQIKLGAEVYIKSFLTDFKMLDKLAIEGTDYILIEMPYTSWKQEHYESVYNCTVAGLKPIMAHIDRYVSHEEKLHNLKSFGAIFQINAESFTSKTMRKKILNYFYNGYAHIIGSDMHNCTQRPNRMKEVYETVSSAYGDDFVKYINENSKRVLNNEDVVNRKLPTLPLIKRLML